MMILSGIYLERLKAHLAENPLQADEVRRVQGMGELYIHKGGRADLTGYRFQYSLTIDGEEYGFYAKIPTSDVTASER